VKLFYVAPLSCILSGLLALGGDVFASDESSFEIAPNCVQAPIESILLVRRNREYCAIRFLKFWTGETKEDKYAIYESYYQGDRTGNFTAKNVKFKKEQLYSPRLRGIGRLSFSFGGNADIHCGPIELFWTYKGWVYFFGESQNQGDYGIELAPTRWKNIGNINVFDNRLKWYRYDEKRPESLQYPVEPNWDNMKR
jgi:hypothetical protein